MQKLSIAMLISIALSAPWGGRASGETFSCDEAGITATVGAAETGDAGPHSLDCAPGEIITTTAGWTISSDLVLDGAGATIECDAVSSGSCLQFRGNPLTTCSKRDERRRLCVALFEPIFAELRNMTIVGRGVEVAFAADLVLDHIVVTGVNFWYAIRVSGRFGDSASTLRLRDSIVTGNNVGWNEGNIVVGSGGHATIVGSSIVSNVGIGLSARRFLGLGTTVELINSTISGNQSAAQIINGGDLSIANSTISADGGYAYTNWVIIRSLPAEPPTFISGAGNAIIMNSIIEGSCDAEGFFHYEFPPDTDLEVIELPGTIISGGGNVEVSGNSCFLTDATDATDQVEVSAAELNLGPLADNGGPTPTHALLPGSLAIDAIPPRPLHRRLR